jgi:hypothetical protein
LKNFSRWKNTEDFFNDMDNKTIRIKQFVSQVKHKDENMIEYYFGHYLGIKKYYIDIIKTKYKKRISVETHLDEAASRWNLVYHTAHIRIENIIEQFESYIKDYEDLVVKLIEQEKEDEKQKKIYGIAANSIETWLDIVCKDISEPYYIKKDKNKIILSIQLWHKTQLDIPIYYSSFQNIMPKIINTIKVYTTTQKETQIKVLISNSSTKALWKIN